MEIANSKLFDMNGQPLTQYAPADDAPTPKKLGSEVSSADSPYFEDYQLRPYNPDVLWQRKGNYDLYDDMRRDDQISATLSLKKLIILNAPWTIEGEDEELNEFLEWALDYCLDDMFEKKLYEILSAIDYGVSVTEKIPEIVDYKGSQKIAFTKFKTRSPHSWEFHTDSKGNIKFLRQLNQDGDLDLKEKDLKRFIIYSYNKEFDNWYGKSDLNKGVYTAWWSKTAVIKFWNIYLERYGMPTAVGTVPRNAGLQDKEKFAKVMKNIQAKSGITMPEDFNLEYLTGQSADASNGYKQAIDHYNMMISRSALIPDLMGFGGTETSGGSFALGKEQFDMFYTIIMYTRNQIERLVNREMIEPLSTWNFGSGKEAVFKFEAIDDDQKEKELTLWLEAVKTGKIPVSNEQVNWFLGQVKAPEISDEDFAKMEEEKEEMKAKLEGKDDNDSEDSGNSDDEDGDLAGKEVRGDGSKESDKKFESGRDRPDGGRVEADGDREYATSRALTKYEEKVDFQKVSDTFDDLDERYYNRLLGDFKLVINGLKDDIAKKKIVERKKIEAVGKLKLRNVNKVAKSMSDLYKDSFRQGTASVSKEFGAEEDIGLNEDDVVDWFNERVFWITDVESENILKKAKNVLLTSIQDGMGTREAMKMLDDALAGYFENMTGKGKAQRIETIVRTNVNTAFNESRTQEFEKVSDEIKGYFYSAILDGRTSEICLRLDSENNPVDGQPRIYKPSELRGITPPNHFNCRSLLVPVFNDEDYEGILSDIPSDVKRDGDGFLKIAKE